MIPPAPSLFTSQPYLAHPPPFLRVFAVSTSGSNEPQAGTQGQAAASKRAKSSVLPTSFDTPDANLRINWAAPLLRWLPFPPGLIHQVGLAI